MADEDWQSVDDWQDTDASQGAPVQSAASGSDWESVDDWQDVEPKGRESSAGGAFLRGARRGIIPAAAAIPAIGYGASLGAGIGAFGGPFAPVTVPVGAGVGALIAGAGAGYLASKAQDVVADKLGLSDNEQFQADTEQHPYAAMAGELAPNLAAFTPGLTRAALTAPALAGRGLGVGAMAGLEAGSEYANEGEVDPAKVVIAGAFGAASYKPTKIGQRLLDAGASRAPAFRPGHPSEAPPGTPENSTPAVPPTTARGAAESRPPPAVDPTAGNPQSAPSRSETRYPKDNAPASGGAAELLAGIPEEQQLALRQSVEKGSFRPPQQEPKPAEEQLPLQTGLEEHMPAPPQQPQGQRMPPADAAVETSRLQREAEQAVHQKVRQGQGELVDQPLTPEQEARADRPARPVEPAPDAAVDHAAQRAIEEAAGKTNANPTEKQKKSGKYRKGVATIPAVGAKVAIETPRGAQRSGVGPDGVPWVVKKMPEHYGEVVGTKAADKDPLDAFVGRDAASKKVFVMDQVDPATGKFDEHKTFFQHTDENAVRRTYNAAHNEPEGATSKRIGHITEMTPEEFNTWKDTHGALKKPVIGEEAAAFMNPRKWKPGDPGYEEQRVKMQTANAAQEYRENAPQRHHQRSIEPEAAAFEKMKGFQPEVTATVKHPPNVQRALELLREHGMEERAAKLEDAEPGEAKALADAVRRRFGEVKVPVKVEGTGMSANSKATAERRGNAVKASDAAFEKFKPAEGETPEQMRARAEQALAHAKEQNGGADPLKSYTPRVKPASMAWLRAAKELLGGKGSQDKRVKDFVAAEKQLRSGDEGAVQDVRDTKRIEADIEKQRRPNVEESEVQAKPSVERAPHDQVENDMIDMLDRQREGEGIREEADPSSVHKGRRVLDAFPGEVPHEEAETMVKSEAADLNEIMNPKEKVHNLDVSKMSEKDIESMAADQAKLSDNIIKTMDKRKDLDVLPKWHAEAEARAEKSGALKRAREAVSMVGREAGERAPVPEASAVRKVPVSDEATKAALASLEKAKARGKRPDDEHHGIDTYAEKKPGQTKRDLVDFFRDEGGSLNVQKIDNFFRSRKPAILTTLKKFLRETWGQPMSNREYLADTVLAQRAAGKQNLVSEHVAALSDDWHRWMTKTSMDDRLKFLDTMEKTADVNDKSRFMQELAGNGVSTQHHDWMADRAPVYRQMLDHAFAMEKAYGSLADYIANYVPHIFKDHKKAVQWINDYVRKNNLGPTWFQKHRAFDLIKEAVAAGHQLKFDNPADLVSHRLMASEDMMSKVWALRELNNIGVAHRSKDLNDQMNRFTKDWHRVVAPNGDEWRISADVAPLWKNAVEAKGLWGNEGTPGNIFRAHMKVKNAWVPIKLMLSAFHFLHVVGNVNIAENIARGLSEPGVMGKVRGVGQGLKWSMTDPLFSLPLDKWGVGKDYIGKQMRDWTRAPLHTLNPHEMIMRQLSEEAGMSFDQSEQLRVAAGRDLTRSLMELRDAKGAIDKTLAIPPVVFNGLRRGVEKTQGWMFEEMIPNLKAASFARSASQLMRQRPDLITNNADRKVALRAIGKSIDNRFGEMFYGGLFWNRTLKDVSVGSMLSLGWNLGQVREAGGSLRNAYVGGRDLYRQATGNTGGKDFISQKQRAVYNASNKGAYVSSYVALSMLTAGSISLALSGQFPSGLDYTFPRAGGNKPDGSPRRLSTMFNTREVPMIYKHIQEKGGGVTGTISGLMSALYNKMVLAPMVDAVTNRDFFGNQLYDPDAPWYKQAGQLVDSTLGNTLNPIAMTGAKRAEQEGGGTRDKALSYAGFGPAPSYISRTDMQNRISHAYGIYGAGAASRPYETSGSGLVQGLYDAATGNVRQQEARREWRGKLDRAMATGDVEGSGEARQHLIREGNMAPKTVAKLFPGQSDSYLFSRLPEPIQKGLVKDMSDAEYVKYVQKNMSLGRSAKVKLLREHGVNP